MSNISLIVTLLFGALFAYFIARMVWAIGRNLVQGMLMRRQLRQRLAGMPLGQALERSGADPASYLHDRQIHDIEVQLRNCEGCQELDQCGDALATDKPTEQFKFCPNYDALFKPKDKDKAEPGGS